MTKKLPCDYYYPPKKKKSIKSQRRVSGFDSGWDAEPSWKKVAYTFCGLFVWPAILCFSLMGLAEIGIIPEGRGTSVFDRDDTPSPFLK